MRARVLLSACLAITGLMAGTGAAEPLPPDDNPKFEELIKKFDQPKYTPEEIKPVLKAEADEDDATVVRLCDALLQRPLRSFQTVHYGHWIHSLAYMHRGRARERQGQGFDAALEDEKRAADAGNLQAITNVAKLLLERWDGDVGDPASAEIEKYFRAGAELGDAFSAAMLGLENLPVRISKEEATYWFLLGLMRDHAFPLEKKREMLEAILESDRKAVESALAKYSLVGAPAPARPGGIPSRGLIASAFVEGDLRGTYASLYGLKTPTTIPPAPTLGENWTLYKTIADDLGFARAYMLVPGTRKFPDAQMRSFPRRAIMDSIQPGDRVFVRCGPLAHVAMVYKVDSVNRTISFTDAAYQFWQPKYNSCVKSFQLVDHSYNRYLAQVSAAEVEKMLDAVITMRDAPTP